MKKYTKVLFLSLMILFTSLYFISEKPITVHAADMTTVSPSQLESYLNGRIQTSNYNNDIYDLLLKYFPSVTILPTEYETRVNGTNHYKILEITPRSYLGDPTTQVSDLKTNVNAIIPMYKNLIAKNNVSTNYFIKNMPNFTVDVMTIKELVDSRVELDGKYDAIVFTSGDYNPAQVSDDCDIKTQDCSYILNTKGILNDITPLKAQEIINKYVVKGVPVFVSNDILNYTNTNLYSYFNNLNASYNNVFYMDYDVVGINNNLPYYQTLAIMKVTELYSLKPYMKINTKPIDYFENSTHTYKTGDIINFNIDLLNKDNANLSFYIDINQDEQFDMNELAAAKTVVKGQNTLTYQLPEMLTGLLRYKLVLTKGTFNYLYEGTLRIRNDIRVINVLNVVSDQVYNNNSLYSNALFDLYFRNNGDYIINVNSCNVRDFSKNNTKWNCSHNTIMDNYDVIMIGQDVFSKPLNKHVYNSLQEQIDKGKPVIFTSSITKGNDKWVSYFGDELKFSDHSTNLYQLNNNVNRLQIVNNSNYVTYPFNLNNEELIVPEDLNYAFNEKYQLDLNNPDLVPLMNMYNSVEYRLDRYDSYNNFYYMKSGNAVYLNVGNNSYKEYKDIEHKLLVDTIINQYIQYQSRDAKLSDYFYFGLNSSYDNALVDYNDPVSFDFTVFTTEVEQLTYVVKVNDEIRVNTTCASNQQINISLTDLVTPTQEYFDRVYVSVTVINDENVNQTKGFYVNVGNFDLYNITFNRTINTTLDNGTQLVEVNKDNKYAFNYALTLKPINVSYMDVTVLPKTFILKNMVFSDVIPSNVHVNTTLTNLVLNGNVLTKTIPDVTYTLVGDQYVPNVTSITFNVPFMVTTTGNYTFDSSQITFKGIGLDDNTFTYNPTTFKAIKPLDDTMVYFNFTDYIYIDGSFIDDLTTKFHFSSEPQITSTSFNLLNTLDGASTNHFNITGHKISTNTVGKQEVQIVVEDVFGNVVRKTFKVYSYQPVTDIDLNYLSIFVPRDPLNPDPTTEIHALPLNIYSNYSNFSIDNLKITPSNPAVVKIDYDYVNNKVKVSGLIPGYTDITVEGYNRNGELVKVTNSILVSVYSDINFRQNYIEMYTGDVYSYNDMYTNHYFGDKVFGIYDYADIIWYTENTNISVVEQGDPNAGQITALSPGTAVVKAQLPNGSYAQLLIRVYDHLSSNSGFSPAFENSAMKLYAETEYNLESFIQVTPSNINMANIVMTFEILDPNGLLDPTYTVPNHFKALTDKEGFITINVTIIEYNKDGVEVARATDTIDKYINKIVDPNVDRGDNKH